MGKCPSPNTSSGLANNYGGTNLGKPSLYVTLGGSSAEGTPSQTSTNPPSRGCGVFRTSFHLLPHWLLGG